MVQVLVSEIVKYKEKDRSAWTKTATATVCKDLDNQYYVVLEGERVGCKHFTNSFGFIGDAITDAVEFCDSYEIRIEEWK